MCQKVELYEKVREAIETSGLWSRSTGGLTAQVRRLVGVDAEEARADGLPDPRVLTPPNHSPPSSVSLGIQKKRDSLHFRDHWAVPRIATLVVHIETSTATARASTLGWGRVDPLTRRPKTTQLPTAPASRAPRGKVTESAPAHSYSKEKKSYYFCE